MKQASDTKHILFAAIAFFMPVILFGQTQYDYYDDRAAAGGVDRALNGILIIGGIVAFAAAILFLLYIISKVYFFFNPKADSDYKKSVAEHEKQKKHEVNIQEQRKNALPQAIDLGLSVKWASFNIGAYCPSDIGDLFYWGDNKPSLKGFPRFSSNVNVNTIGDISGNSDYDAATYIYGEHWRIPSAAECKELIDLCEWTSKSIDGIEGRQIKGPNGNTIFLPYNIQSYVTSKFESGFYWTSCPSFRDGLKESSQDLRFGKDWKIPAEIWCSSVGALRSIRPVFSTNVADKQNDTRKIIDSFHQIDTIEMNDLDSIYKTFEDKCKIREDEKKGSSLWGISFDEENTFTDKNGVVYSLDGKRLLDGASCDCETYEILEGTEFVCFGAFKDTLTNSLFNRKDPIMKKLILPSSLCYIPTSALPDKCEIVSNTKSYSSINHLLIDNRKRSVVKCLDHYIQKVIIGEPIKEIEKNAFLNCIALREVSLPNSLIKIGEAAFRNCEILRSINLHDGIIIIENEAFYNCLALHINSLPTTLQYLGNSAFKLCNIDSATIPESIQNIGNKPFPIECHNLKSKSNRFIIKDSLLIDSLENEIIQLVDSHLPEVKIPNGIVKMRASAFAHTDIVNITIPSSITDMDYGVFWGCKKLSNVQLNNSIKILPNSTFAYCDSLVNITIPDSIETIGCGAFYNCKNLHDLTLNIGLRVIENRAFEGCENLVSLTISESVEKIGDNNGINCFQGCNKLNEIYYDAKEATLNSMHKKMFYLNIGTHVKTLPNNLLSNNNLIESLIVPENVERIQKGCIVECKNLKEITILSHSIILEDGWLRKCEGLRTIRIQQDLYSQLLPLIPHSENLRIKKIYKHQFFFFKW